MLDALPALANQEARAPPHDSIPPLPLGPPLCRKGHHIVLFHLFPHPPTALPPRKPRPRHTDLVIHCSNPAITSTKPGNTSNRAGNFRLSARPLLPDKNQSTTTRAQSCLQRTCLRRRRSACQRSHHQVNAVRQQPNYFKWLHSRIWHTDDVR